MARSARDTAPLLQVQREKVDGVTHQRRRQLQVVRAEGQACRQVTDSLDREMAAERSKLEAAVAEYEWRKAKLAGREVDEHGRLAAALRDRSAAELDCETVMEHVENVLRAERTAGTVRAYQLDARWRRLHGRYRGFVLDVLNDGGQGDGGPPTRKSRPPMPPPKGRRFFTVADEFSARYRRESLRTCRSLHLLATGFLHEAEGGVTPRRRRSSATVLEGARPERVLNKLRNMQAQCARIAERVRRRTGCEPPVAGLASGPTGDHRPRDSADSLAEAHRKAAEGREYVRKIRELAERAADEMQRENQELRRLLDNTFVMICVGGSKTHPTTVDGPTRCTIVETAGRLESACFELFARLDAVQASDVMQRRRSDGDGRGLVVRPAATVVALCLRTVQTNRRNAVQRSRDIADRVNNFRKAATRLLLATANLNTGDRAIVTRGHRRTSAGAGWPETAAFAKTAAGRNNTREKTYGGPRSKKNISTAESAADVATVTILCPPSIGTVDCVKIDSQFGNGP